MYVHICVYIYIDDIYIHTKNYSLFSWNSHLTGSTVYYLSALSPNYISCRQGEIGKEILYAESWEWFHFRTERNFKELQVHPSPLALSTPKARVTAGLSALRLHCPHPGQALPMLRRLLETPLPAYSQAASRNKLWVNRVGSGSQPVCSVTLIHQNTQGPGGGRPPIPPCQLDHTLRSSQRPPSPHPQRITVLEGCCEGSIGIAVSFTTVL